MWHNFEKEKVRCYVSENFKYRPNLAIFSFCKTLVQGVPSEKNPINLFSPEVVPFLHKVGENGSIIIIENKFLKLNMDRLIDEFRAKLNSPNRQIEFMAVFILSPNKYKKPNTNIISLIGNIYKANGCDTQGPDWFDKKKSIVIGANAGRYGFLQICPDENDCDRAFAHNLNIETFRTPEDIFYNTNISRRWAWKMDTADKFLEEQKNKQEPEFSSFIDVNDGNKKLIFIAGALSSGKTLLARRILNFLKESNKGSVSMLDINTSNTGEICEALDNFNENADMFLVVADMLYNETFARYLSIVNTSIDIICVELDSSRNACIFLDRFRLQISTSPELTELKKEDIARWFFTDRKKWNHIKYVTFPLVLRTRPESFFHY